MVKAHGFDTKNAYHLVRLLLEVEQILIEGDLDLERNREQLKAIRRGDWSKEQILSFFDQKERSLEDVYSNSTLPWGPDYDGCRNLMLDVLEQHFGSLSKAVVREDKVTEAFRQIEDICNGIRQAGLL